MPKQTEQSASTEEGIQIDESEQHQENARLAIRESWHPDSKVTAQREQEPMKHDEQIRVMEEGIQIRETL
jgi:hypothetical protein